MRLPRKNLVDLFTYVLGDPVSPYRFTMSNDVIHLAYRTHLSDLDDPAQRERIGNDIIHLGERADEMDTYMVKQYGCPWAAQSRLEQG